MKEDAKKRGFKRKRTQIKKMQKKGFNWKKMQKNGFKWKNDANKDYKDYCGCPM